jgi:uncharacterized protein YprB with RNaseH-like and TPR domain
MNKIKRLFFDIETSPNIGLFWTAGYKQNISHDSIIKERAIICICYKWEDNDKVYSLTWDKNQSDKGILKQFIKIANEADELIGHNGDKYDLPWVRTRCLLHKIEMFPKYNTVDTLKQSRSKFKFNSNKLDYIANFLGIGTKISTSFNLWKEIVLNNNQKAMDDMIKYCKEDVILLEKIYKRLAPHFPEKIRANDDVKTCPTCSSSSLVFSQKRTSVLGTIRVQMKCKKCKRYHTVSERTYKSIIG